MVAVCSFPNKIHWIYVHGSDIVQHGEWTSYMKSFFLNIDPYNGKHIPDTVSSYEYTTNTISFSTWFFSFSPCIPFCCSFFRADIKCWTHTWNIIQSFAIASYVYNILFLCDYIICICKGIVCCILSRPMILWYIQ